MLQLGTSICSLELPVHTLLTVASLVMPRRKFLVKFFDTVYAPFYQTLVPDGREFNLSDVKPAVMLGSVLYFKTLCYSLTPSGQGFSEKEDAADAIPHIFVVLVSCTCTVGSEATSYF